MFTRAKLKINLPAYAAAAAAAAGCGGAGTKPVGGAWGAPGNAVTKFLDQITITFKFIPSNKQIGQLFIFKFFVQSNRLCILSRFAVNLLSK